MRPCTYNMYVPNHSRRFGFMGRLIPGCWMERRSHEISTRHACPPRFWPWPDMPKRVACKNVDGEPVSRGELLHPA